ncbi:ATPase family AAA domain-containing protein 3B 4 [Paraphaeosphaeria sporulosa]
MGKALHEVYDKVVSPGWYLDIEILDDSDAPPPEEPTSYDSKVKYSIDCFRKNAQGSNDYMWTVSASNPTTFEYDMDTRGDLPVIEEKKILDISITSRMRKPDTGFKGRLRRPQHDLVSGALLTVHSHYLLNVLKSIIQYATGVDDYTNGDFFFPYKDLFRHRAEIEDYKTFHKARSQHSAEYNEQCDKHIDILLQYLDSHPTIRYPEHKMIWNRPKPMTTFAGLWLLLKPCTDVYVQDNEKLNAFVIDKVSGGVSYPVEPSAALRATEYSVRVWNLHFDGKIIYRRSQWILVPYFDGERDITSLPLFPVQYQDTADASATRDSLIERGKKYFSYCKSPTFLEYSGAGLKDGWLKYKRTRVVVDHRPKPWTEERFKALGWNLDRHITENNLGEELRAPQCECTECTKSRMSQVQGRAKFSDYDDIHPDKVDGLSDHQYLLLASHVYAHILQDRDFDIVDVGGLAEPTIVEDAINRLVMDEVNKGVIKAIARTYTENKAGARFKADFIYGKGEGQILLLHGPPGTGKTLTAESVAEFTRRPLLNLTPADLGEDAYELETNLMRFFKYANEWDAVVLIDEADVYLEARSEKDLKRNGVVSIFLRALDYFRGILFLTTNRIGRFDEAFMTRIHVAVGYERLTDSAREQIWDNMFDTLDEDFKRGGPQVDYHRHAKEYVKEHKDVKALEWNGREIRNAFQTAVALAVNDSKEANERGNKNSKPVIPEIKEKHLAQVVKLSTAFKKYMKAARHNKDESENAYYYGNRDDEANSPTRRRSEPPK